MSLSRRCRLVASFALLGAGDGYRRTMFEVSLWNYEFLINSVLLVAVEESSNVLFEY